jgi:penicillin-binding protein 2
MAKDLFFEEAVLDDLAGDLSSLETPLSRKAFILVGIVSFLVVFLALGRVAFLGLWRGEFYGQQSMINMGEISEKRAQRGVIFDDSGNPLVKNTPSFRVSLLLADFFKNAGDREKISADLEEALDLAPGFVDIALQNADLERQNSIILARGLKVDDVIKIKNLNLESVRVEDDFERDYYGQGIFSHIVGYTGSTSEKDVRADASLSYDDIVGKSGLESYYEKELRGKDGRVINYRNAKGEIIDSKLLGEAENGLQLHLAIDSGLQAYFYDSLSRTLRRLGSSAGIGIAVNPQNGKVLSLVSLPSFDNNEIKSADLVNSAKPFFNRAVSGEYAPGSTIKPLVAFAALKEGLISPEKEIFSAGFIDIPNPYNPDKPSRFLDWKPNGWVNLFSAIAKSSNIYFYAIGGGLDDVRGLGIERLKEYWKKFGLGQKTGIDLPGERAGFLPDEKTKEESGGEIWRIGDTYNVSIGQGDLLVTPIQLINCISAIGNGGKIYRPFLVNKITDGSGKITKEISPEILADFSEDAESVRLIQSGMLDTVRKSYGTANLLSGLPISVAAKTGTAQIEGNTKINALFVGYLPVEALEEEGAPIEKQIAILVLVEDAREGGMNAVPVANEVFGWYYENRIKNHE